MGPAPQDLPPAQVDELKREGAQLVDVREPGEREAGRIPDDTAHIELDDLSEQAGALDRDRPLVFYCRTGRHLPRSPAAVSHSPPAAPSVRTTLRGAGSRSPARYTSPGSRPLMTSA